VGLKASHIQFAYHVGRPVLQEIRFEADAGQVVSLLGPNGSGKTTMLRIIGGFVAPDSGSLTIDNLDAHKLSHHERAERIGYVPQQPAVAFGYELADYVALGRHALGRRDAAGFTAQALDRLDLVHLADRPVCELSAGQRQRAAFARAYCQLLGDRPAGCTRVLLADEPMSALDPRHALLVTALLGELAQTGVLVVTVLHDLALASRVSDRVVLLSDDGSLLSEGSSEEVLTDQFLEAAYGVAFKRIVQENRLLAILPEQPR
jgi:iron complex transport system ATP-binding protein